MPPFVSRKRLLGSRVDGGCFPQMSSETKRFDLTGDSCTCPAPELLSPGLPGPSSGTGPSALSIRTSNASGGDSPHDLGRNRFVQTKKRKTRRIRRILSESFFPVY